ncbi:MAG TPA: DUF3179 domain-containing (seleno)protein [Puia sp.]|jgi:hypothetical protein|nr:DUF3179 domain-containing (seleno)protein [Puia sp.]
MKRLLLVLGVLLLFATEIFRVYFIMPFPGSQHRNTIDLAYFIDRNRLWLRIAGFVLVGYALLIHPAKRRNPYDTPRRKSSWPAIGLFIVAMLYAVVFYFFNYRFEADKMFHQPQQLTLADSAANQIPSNRLVIGLVVNNQAKAYPIQLIGYHHQVRDTLGSTPVMVTYCTVCRTGRVYVPLVRGRAEEFRLVGMDHFNAMFEDATTKSWWQQATGVAVAGPLKGERLAELPSGQYTLGEWLRLHPGSRIMQPDPADTAHYSNLGDYDDGTIKGSLEHRDSASWKPKSWVVGVLAGNNAKAYDWSSLNPYHPINDTIGNIPVLVYLPDSSNFHVWSRVINGKALSFKPTYREIFFQGLLDSTTNSFWTREGLCIDGPLKGQQLQPLQSYQEFWHSWSHFHPTTTQYNP